MLLASGALRHEVGGVRRDNDGVAAARRRRPPRVAAEPHHGALVHVSEQGPVLLASLTVAAVFGRAERPC